MHPFAGYLTAQPVGALQPSSGTYAVPSTNSDAFVPFATVCRRTMRSASETAACFATRSTAHGAWRWGRWWSRQRQCRTPLYAGADPSLRDRSRPRCVRKWFMRHAGTSHFASGPRRHRDVKTGSTDQLGGDRGHKCKALCPLSR